MYLWSLLQYAAFLLVVVALWSPVGGYMARVFQGQRTWLDPFLGLVMTAVIVGGLNYFPALALGPIIEHVAAGADTRP